MTRFQNKPDDQNRDLKPLNGYFRINYSVEFQQLESVLVSAYTAPNLLCYSTIEKSISLGTKSSRLSKSGGHVESTIR